MVKLSEVLEHPTVPIHRDVEEAARRIVKGVELLNEKVPTWINKIELDDLELEDSRQCVLGQAAAKSALRAAGYFAEMPIIPGGEGELDYSDAVDALGIDGTRYGFDVADEDVPEDDYKATYGDLNHLWTSAILLVRQGKKVTVKRLLKNAYL
jgi:hypothetical protein